MCKLCKRGSFAGTQTGKIKRLVHRVILKFKPSKLILFGSYARGDWHEGSDIDLMIIGDFKERFFDRIGKVLELNDTGLDLEPFVYTLEEFERIKGRDFIRTALEEGLAC